MATKFTICASLSPLTPALVRSTLGRLSREGSTPTEVRATDAMIAAWDYVGLSAAYVLKSEQFVHLPEYFKDVLREKPQTMGGIPLRRDSTVPVGTVRFLAGENVVAEIRNLAIPTGYGE